MRQSTNGSTSRTHQMSAIPARAASMYKAGATFATIAAKLECSTVEAKELTLDANIERMIRDGKSEHQIIGALKCPLADVRRVASNAPDLRPKNSDSDPMAVARRHRIEEHQEKLRNGAWELEL